MQTSDERKALAAQFASDVIRMQRCLHDVGKQVSDDDVIDAWAEYSNSVCAGWLTLPEDDDALRTILMKYLPGSVIWHVRIVDPADGSNDGVLRLPADLLVQLTWTHGDTIVLGKTAAGEVILRSTH